MPGYISLDEDMLFFAKSILPVSLPTFARFSKEKSGR